MGTLHLIEYRHDERTRYLVKAGQLLAVTHGCRYAVHLMLAYGVTIAVVTRLLS